ncbi:FkbM family methyltransferase [bacterium]|nr:FkbM family methyltransferase [bacterium]
MNKLLKKTISNIFRHLGLGITQYQTLQRLRQISIAMWSPVNDIHTLQTLSGGLVMNSDHYDRVETLRRVSLAMWSPTHDLQVIQRLNNKTTAHTLLTHFKDSTAQLRQDLFVLSHLGFKQSGYFVEIGATNGYDISNTYLMETNFGWHGILAEPAPIWHRELNRNRKCHIEKDCVWKESNATVEFNQSTIAELSTISSFTDTDCHKEARKTAIKYSINTISLNDLLAKYSAPNYIDYLSIDTEGSEYEILSNFDFSKYNFGVITCDHNYSHTRDNVYALLTKNGYRRVFEDISLFDDWYIK